MSTAKNRLVAVFLGLVMALAVAACSKDDTPPANDVGSWVNPATQLIR